MGRSQLQYNRRARGRGGGRGGAGRGGAGGGGGGGGAPSGRGPVGRAAAAKASQQAALRKLPSNQYRFQRGSGGEATAGGPRRGGGDDEGDDLRAYALSTDSRLDHRHVLAEGASGEEEAEEELVKDLPSLSLDLLGLAQGLCCLPAHVRMGDIDPPLTEGLEYRHGASSSSGSSSNSASRRTKPAVIEKQQEKTLVSPPVAPPPLPPPPLESALEKLDISASAPQDGAKDVLSDLDSLLALGGSGDPGAGTGAAGGGVMAMDEDLLDDLLGSSAAAAAPPPPPPPPSSTTTAKPTSGAGGGGGGKKLSSLDAGDY